MESLSPSQSSSSSPSSSSSVLPPLMANPATSTAPNPTIARESNSRRRKKKMKTQSQQSPSSRNPNPNPNSAISKFSWKSESTQQLYTTKLLHAFRRMRLSSASSSPSPPRRRGRAVREAADRVLATAARGRTRWSRAILAGKLRLKFMNNKKLKRQQRARITGDGRPPRPEILKLKVKNAPAVQRKAKVLGKLVPGCRKEPLPVVLEEAVDYIPALEMQVRTLRQILALFSGDAGESSGEGSNSGPIAPENGSG